MQELLSNLGINWKLLFAQTINFLVIFWLLQKFVFKRLIAFLEARKQHIEKGVALTEQAKREIERIDDARKREIEKAKQQAEALLRESKTMAQEKAKGVILEAKTEEEKILAKALQDAQHTKEEALKKAQDEIRERAIAISEKILARALREKDEARFVQEALKELEVHPYAK